MIQSLAQLPVSNLARSDKDDGFETKSRGRAEYSQRCGSVSSGSTCNTFGTNHAGMCKGSGHAVVFKAPGGVHAFVLEQQTARLNSNIGGHRVAPLEQGLALTNRYNLTFRDKWEKFAKSPHAREILRIGSLGPLFFEPF